MFVLQNIFWLYRYEVRFQNGQECGGAYLKLLSQVPNMDLRSYHDKTPYTLMFGPDKCGNDHKVFHFLFHFLYLNFISGIRYLVFMFFNFSWWEMSKQIRSNECGCAFSCIWHVQKLYSSWNFVCFGLYKHSKTPNSMGMLFFCRNCNFWFFKTVFLTINRLSRISKYSAKPNA